MTRIAIPLAVMLCACGQQADQAQGSAAVQELPPAASVPLDVNAGDEATAQPDALAGQGTSACRVQDGKAVPANAIRAIGTEPFWGATVEGRCVTYSTPEDQEGTRVWTRFSGAAESGHWAGALDGQPFVMATRPEAGCSDGMSDTRYPIAVTLTVRGEQRTGCARPNGK